MQVSGIVKDVSKQRSGTNARGTWTMQWVEFVDGHRVKVWTRPDLSNAKNKFVTIDGVTEDTDKDNKPCFNLSPNEGSIKVEDRQPGTQVPVGAVGGPIHTSKTVRTIDDYEAVLHRAVSSVAYEFKASFPTGDGVPQAVAQVVTSFMAAYVRGDFAVPADDTADGEKVPF